MKFSRPVTLPLFVLLVVAAAASAESPSGDLALEDRYREAARDLAGPGEWTLVVPDADWAADEARLAAVVLSGTEWNDRSAGERAGILVALADRTALDGDRARARTLYGILEGSGAEPLEGWASYMLAGLDFAAADYPAAAARYDRVCAEEDRAEWVEHACAMAGLARRLDELQLRGGDHGDPVPATP